MKKLRENFLVLIILAMNFIGIIIIYNTEINSATASINAPVKDRLESIKEKGVLTVASSGDAPFAFIDSKTNELTGIDGELITEVAKRLGINKVEMIQVPFENLLTELNTNNNIDMVTSGMYVTDERKKEALFTNVWYKESEAIIIPKFSQITFKEDLKNAVIGAQNGTAFLELALKWKKDGLVKDIVTFDNQSEVISAVNNGKIDAAITDSIVASSELVTNNNLYLKILAPYEPKLPGMVAAAVRKSDNTLADAVNEKINEMTKSGALFKILKKYGANV